MNENSFEENQVYMEPYSQQDIRKYHVTDQEKDIYLTRAERSPEMAAIERDLKERKIKLSGYSSEVFRVRNHDAGESGVIVNIGTEADSEQDGPLYWTWESENPKPKMHFEFHFDFSPGADVPDVIGNLLSGDGLVLQYSAYEGQTEVIFEMQKGEDFSIRIENKDWPWGD